MGNAAVAPTPSAPEARIVGHGLSVLLGFASIIGGFAGLASSLPPVVGVTLLASGALIVVLTVYSLKYSRAAWAFLIAMLVVLETVTFFGAPKIRNVLGIELWQAALIPLLKNVAIVALVMIRGDYRAR